MIKLWDDNTKEITDHPGMVELNPDTGGITFMAELNNENGRYKMGDGLNKIKKYEREVLRSLLNRCTPKQQLFFEKMYPEGIDKMSSQNIYRAIRQSERTIAGNEEKS